MLLNVRARICAQREQCTALHMAVECACDAPTIEMVSVLLHHEGVDVDLRDTTGMTAFEAVCTSVGPEDVKTAVVRACGAQNTLLARARGR